MVKFGNWIIYECEAVADGDCAYQHALFITNTDDEFHDGDCVLFGYDVLGSEEELMEILNNDHSAFTRYHEVLKTVRHMV